VRIGLVVSAQSVKRPRRSTDRHRCQLDIIVVSPFLVSDHLLVVLILPLALPNQAAKSSNQAVNTLAAIESNDVDEEPWKIDNYNCNEDEVPADLISSFESPSLTTVPILAHPY
jgi:hypothetical protein